MTDVTSSDECAGCALQTGRRDFLRDAAFALAALAAVGSNAGAMSAHIVHALGVTDETATYPMPAADGVYIDKKQEVIIARVGNQVFAFELACPHQNTALRWAASEHRFQCPKHHSQYAPDGAYIEGRATRSMDRFGVRRDGGNLIVNLDKVFESDRDLTGWKSAALTL